nr:GntR family transcriptional regulator [Oceanobacillus rekensis]
MSAEKEAIIVDDILRCIATGELKPGAKLPSENELAMHYHVPRITVRNAFTKLEERGYIYSNQGKGRYLKEGSMQIQLHLTDKISFTEKMKKLGYDVETRNIYCEKIKFDPDIYQILHANEENSIYKVGRLRYINGEPIAIHYSFVSESKFPMIKEDGPTIESMFAYYRKLGHKDFSSSKTLLSINFPTSDEQQMLGCKSMVPLIVVESNCMDGHSKELLEHTKVLYRSDRFKYDITMD